MEQNASKSLSKIKKKPYMQSINNSLSILSQICIDKDLDYAEEHRFDNIEITGGSLLTKVVSPIFNSLGLGSNFRNPEIQAGITVEQNIDSAQTTSEDLSPLSGESMIKNDACT